MPKVIELRDRGNGILACFHIKITRNSLSSFKPIFHTRFKIKSKGRFTTRFLLGLVTLSESAEASVWEAHLKCSPGGKPLAPRVVSSRLPGNRKGLELRRVAHPPCARSCGPFL